MSFGSTFFVGITSLVDGEVVKLPCVSCTICSSALTYNSKTGGTSHLRRHIEHGLSNCGSSASSFGIGSFFKPIDILSSVKSRHYRKVR